MVVNQLSFLLEINKVIKSHALFTRTAAFISYENMVFSMVLHYTIKRDFSHD